LNSQRKERVDEAADRHDLVAHLGIEEVVLDGVAVVHRQLGRKGA